MGQGLLLAGLAQAQPDVDRALQRQDEQLRQWQQQHLPDPDARLQTPAPTAPQRLPTETPCVEIRDVRIDSAGLPLDADVLLGPDRTDPPQGRCLGQQGIALLPRRAQDALIARGYITTRVAATSQNLREGVLVLTVLPGRIAQVRGAGTGSTPEWQGPPLIAREGDVLDLRELEQSLENLRRNDGADAAFQVVPAAEEGHSDLIVDYRQRQRR